MATQDYKRKLTAILSADVKGYSRLMGDDEEATVSTITAYRGIIGSVVQRHRGRVVDSPGDNILAEFSSVVDAVRGAVDIQEKLATRNAELPENRRMEFRIGVNLGDVIHEEERIYGDGVNIAARIESLADGGGICISGSAFEQVKNKLELGYEYLGEHPVKNIAEPVRVYRVLMEPEAVGKVIGEERVGPKKGQRVALAVMTVLILIVGGVVTWRAASPPKEVASVGKMAFPLPDEPSIAVLPFDNMTGDPEQEFFSDGITEQIIAALSKISSLFVIARNSTFTYKGKPVKVQQVSEELGVRYVLEGSVQRSSERVRVTAQLIDAIKGNHIWSETYDRQLKDIFAVQDDITQNILTALQVELTQGEQARVWARGTENLEAYLKVLQAQENIYQMNIESNARARQLAEEATALDPEYASAYLFLGRTHGMDVYLGSSKSPKDSIVRGIELTQKALALDDSSADAHSQLGFLYIMMGQHDKGIAEAERAVALNPNFANAYNRLGWVLRFAGRSKEAIPVIKKGIRLNPFPPGAYFYNLATACAYAGQCEEAIAASEKALQRESNNLLTHIATTVSYSLCGKDEEARETAAGVLRINPKFSTKYFAKKVPYKNQADIDRYIGALRKAGLPDKPPMPLPDKPSIAVLAFDNMSADPKQEYLADGISENLISSLSKISKLFVIARNSTFTYKGKPVRVQQIGRELGARYVLEGSVQRAGDRLRVTAQLIDAKTGNHLWSERYDRDLKDVFAVQDDITKNIIMAMQIKLTGGEQARAAAKGTDNLDAYLKYLQANEYLHRGNMESNAMAKQLTGEAIALDPEYAMAYGVLARLHIIDFWLDTSKSQEQSLAEATELLQKAIALDDTYAEAYGILGYVFSLRRQPDEALTQAEKAVALDPNSAELHYRLAKVLVFDGKNEEAIPEYKIAIRLNPIPPSKYFWSLGLAHAETGQYDEAITWCEKAVRQAPDNLMARIMMTTVYSWSGRDEEARAEAAEVLRINPKFSLERFAKRADPELVSALHKAGLK